MAVSSTDKNVATSFFDIPITYDSYALRVKQGLGDIVRAGPILMLVGKYLEVAPVMASSLPCFSSGSLVGLTLAISTG